MLALIAIACSPTFLAPRRIQSCELQLVETRPGTYLAPYGGLTLVVCRALFGGVLSSSLPDGIE
jgi:hypothetical protein